MKAANVPERLCVSGVEGTSISVAPMSIYGSPGAGLARPEERWPGVSLSSHTNLEPGTGSGSLLQLAPVGPASSSALLKRNRLYIF